MSKKKQKNTELSPREMRLKAFEQKQKQQQSLKEDSRDLFKKYFVKLKKKLDLEPSMEKVLWLHLKAIKCDKSDKFDEGIKNFGYKL